MLSKLVSERLVKNWKRNVANSVWQEMLKTGTWKKKKVEAQLKLQDVYKGRQLWNSEKSWRRDELQNTIPKNQQKMY